MRLRTPSGRDLWLAYGMNVHAGGSVETLEAALRTTVEPLRERLDVDGPFGLALRLDRDGILELHGDDERRALLRQWLVGSDLVPFTGNAFVLGDFHGAGVKAEVYRPTWRESARVEYTMAFAEVMASLAGPGHLVSLSTAPGSFKPFAEDDGFELAAAKRLAEVARRLVDLEERTGVRVRVGLEPEPLCTIETVDEAVRFFRGPLHRLLGGEPRALEHLGVCYDVCHQAVEGEDPAAGLALLESEGIAVVKLQVSCALVLPDPADPKGREALARFDEPRWLHQVGSGQGETMRRAADLPEALRGPEASAWAAAPGPWRVHFHVPVHREQVVGPLQTTRAVLEGALRHVVRSGVTDHLEIETYTWEGLPAEVRAGGLVESLAREYEWVLEVLAREGVVRAPDPEDDAP